MSWYSDGTIQVAANGTVATGTGTQFIGNVRIGDGITIAGSTALHEVTGVSSNTQLTFQPPYAGAAGSGKAYRIAPVLGYDKDLSDAFNQIRLQWGTQLGSLQPWAYAATGDIALGQLGGSASGIAVFKGNQAAGRTALGLGTAATATVQTSTDDPTINRLLTNQSWGLGSAVGQIKATTADTEAGMLTQFFTNRQAPGANNPFPGGYTAGVHISYANGTHGVQFAAGVTSREFYGRVLSNGTWAPPRKLWTDADFALGTSGDAVGKLNTTNTWTGIQSFAGGAGAGIRSIATNVSATFMGFFRADGTTRTAYIGVPSNANEDARMHVENGSFLVTPSLSGTTRQYLFSTTSLSCGNNQVSSGAAGAGWSVVYASTGAINTSDAREKTPVRSLTKPELNWAISLADEIGAYQWLASIDEKGDFARDHIGTTVQRAIELGESLGLDPYSYSFICYDQWPERTELVEPARYDTVMHEQEVEAQEVPDPDNEGETITIPVVVKEAYSEEVLVGAEVVQTYPAGERYSFRPDGLHAFIIAGLAEQGRRDRARLDAIEQALNITN
jgi:hypothetical protein